MKHTNFRKKMIALKVQAKNELIAALKAHGGQYVWREILDIDAEDEHGKIPCVLTTNEYGIAGDAYVYKIVIDNRDKVCVFGRRDDEAGDYFEVYTLEDMSVDSIDFLIEQIPETADVSDVSEKNDEFEITSVCRDDLEHCGYDAAKVSDEDMKYLASEMSDAYCQNGFWEDLRSLADLYNFPKLEE